MAPQSSAQSTRTSMCGRYTGDSSANSLGWSRFSHQCPERQHSFESVEKATGESQFDVGTLLLPGGPLSNLTKLDRIPADVADASKASHVPNLGRLSDPAPAEIREHHDNRPLRRSALWRNPG